MKCVRVGQFFFCSSGFHMAQLLVGWAHDLGSLRSLHRPHNPVNLDCAGAVPLFTFAVQPFVLEGRFANLNQSDLESCCLPMLGAFLLHEHSTSETPHVWLGPWGHGAHGSWRAFPILL